MRTSFIFTFVLKLSTIGFITCEKHPLLMISFDGLQAGKFETFLRQNPNCTFNKIIKNGVKANYMIPSFPTLTFPNHVSLVTG